MSFQRNYCIVDGKPCPSQHTSFCCKECKKYHEYITSKNVSSNNSHQQQQQQQQIQYRQQQRQQQQQSQQIINDDDYLDELEFEEEAYQANSDGDLYSFNLNESSSSNSSEYPSRKQSSASSVFSLSSNGTISAETSPLLTPNFKDANLQDIKFNSLFDKSQNYNLVNQNNLPSVDLFAPTMNNVTCLDALTYNYPTADNYGQQQQQQQQQQLYQQQYAQQQHQYEQKNLMSIPQHSYQIWVNQISRWLIMFMP